MENLCLLSPNQSISVEDLDWTPGILVQVHGRYAPDVAARVLADHPHLPAVWIKKSLVEFPLAIFQRKVNLKKVLFIQGERDSFWAAGSLLHTQLFPFLIYQAPMNAKIFRTLAEWAEKYATCILVISDRDLPVDRHNIRSVGANQRGMVNSWDFTGSEFARPAMAMAE